jgi:DNA-binding transcriptional ArsR family regulator
MEEMLKALAEPNRRKILQLVKVKELSSGAIASQFKISAPAVSQHLAVLHEVGLIRQRREGSFRYYSAQPEALRELREFLDGFWQSSLEQLKEAAEWEERERDVERTRQ